MSLRDRLDRLEDHARLLVQRQQVSRAAARTAYEARWREHHENLARVLSAGTPEEIDLEALGMVRVPARDPEEVALARKLEREREVGQQESATATTQERTAAWEAERRRILAARARYRRECEENGQSVVFAAGEPPLTVPDWYMTKPDGVTLHRSTREQTRTNADGTRQVELADYDAVAGRRVSVGPPELTPEQKFALEAEKQRKEKT